MINVTGKILKSVGGFYHVETPCGVLICKARGLFRLKGISPFAGDNVKIQTDEHNEPVIIEIEERKNSIIRPPLANLDYIVMVISTCEPIPNAYVIDKLLAVFESKSINPLLVFTKTDKRLENELIDIYKKIGYTVFLVDNNTGEGVNDIVSEISGKTSALIGNSGVGKSSLLNIIMPSLNVETATISKKLGRGKHTTRQAELYPFNGGYIADTPGFSTVEISKYCEISIEEISACFREFKPHLNCRFANCAHIKEKGCTILSALENNEISQSRYESYKRMFIETRESEQKY